MGCCGGSSDDDDNKPKGCCGKCCEVICDMCPNNWCGYWIGLGCCGPRVTKKAVMTITPFSERACTDVPCCLLLFGCIGLQIATVFYALDMGATPFGLIQGVDWMNVRCDENNPMGDLAIFPDLTHPEFQICAKDCAQSVTDGRMITYIPILGGEALPATLSMEQLNPGEQLKTTGLDPSVAEMPMNLELQSSYCPYKEATKDDVGECSKDSDACVESDDYVKDDPTVDCSARRLNKEDCTDVVTHIDKKECKFVENEPVYKTGTACTDAGGTWAAMTWRSKCEEAEEVPQTGYASAQFYKFCMPDIGETFPTANMTQLAATVEGFNDVAGNVMNTMNRAIGDITIGWHLLIGSAGVSLIMCYLYGWCVKKCGKVIVWVSLVTMVLGGGAAAAACIYHAPFLREAGWMTAADVMEYAGYILAVVSLLMAVGLVCLASRINTAAQVAAESARAMEDLWTLMLVPFITILFYLAYFVFWIYVILAGFSIAETEPKALPDANLVSKCQLVQSFIESFECEYYESGVDGTTFVKSHCNPERDVDQLFPDIEGAMSGGLEGLANLGDLFGDAANDGQGYAMMKACVATCEKLGCCGIVRNNTAQWDPVGQVVIDDVSQHDGETVTKVKMLCSAVDTPYRKLGTRPDLYNKEYSTKEAARIYTTANGKTLTINDFSEVTGYEKRLNYEKYKQDDTFKYVCLGHLFVLFFAIDFICYMAYAIKAGVFAEWYFAVWEETDKILGGHGRRKVWGGENGISHCPVMASCCRVTRYHMGSLAFGAFLIAVIQIMQVILAYIQDKMSKEGDVDDSSNEALKKVKKMQAAIFAGLQCMLECLKDCIDRCNKNGIVIMSIYGTPFCSSGLKAFALVFKNLGRVAVLYLVQAYITRIGKLCCALGTMGIAFLVMQFYPYYEQNLSSYIFLALLCFIIAYVSSLLYFNIYQTAIDTIFLCFLCDEEEGGGTANLADPRFVKIVDEQAGEARKVTANTPSLRNAMKRAQDVPVEGEEPALPPDTPDVELAPTGPKKE